MGKKTDTIIGVIVVLLLIITIYGFSQQYVEVKEQQDRLDNPPLHVRISNDDDQGHEVAFAVSDINNTVIFNGASFLPPGEYKRYGDLIREKGIYSVKVVVDGNSTAVEKVNLNEEKTLVVTISSKGLDFGYILP